MGRLGNTGRWHDVTQQHRPVAGRQGGVHHRYIWTTPLLNRYHQAPWPLAGAAAAGARVVFEQPSIPLSKRAQPGPSGNAPGSVCAPQKMALKPPLLASLLWHHLLLAGCWACDGCSISGTASTGVARRRRAWPAPARLGAPSSLTVHAGAHGVHRLGVVLWRVREEGAAPQPADAEPPPRSRDLHALNIIVAWPGPGLAAPAFHHHRRPAPRPVARRAAGAAARTPPPARLRAWRPERVILDAEGGGAASVDRRPSRATAAAVSRRGIRDE